MSSTVTETGGDHYFASPAAALRAVTSGLDCLNAWSADLDGAACGELLIGLGGAQSRLTAAHAALLRRFDASDGHEADGYRTSSAWLAGKAGMSKQGARAAVREMRHLRERPQLEHALARGDLTGSLAAAIRGWTKDLPSDLRAEADQILLEAARAGASLDDLRLIAACALEKWRGSRPDGDDPGPDPGERSLSLGTTLGGAGVIRGELTPECAAAVQAVLDALGKRNGAEDDRSEPQRFHDALQLACTLLLRARLVPDRAGADTQAIVHIPLSALRDLPGAEELEDEWLRARAEEPGCGDASEAYLRGQEAEAAACDAQVRPVVTGRLNLDIIDQIIAFARAAATPTGSPEARQALRYSIARLALDLVSGPRGIASLLRTRLLHGHLSTPSLALDVGRSRVIPGQIRRAVQLRDRHCAWPGCDQPPAHCDVHHVRHQADGGETSVSNCVLACQFHHDHLIHRKGWTLVLHPDGTTSARSPDGTRVLHSHAPPPPQPLVPL